MHGCASLYDQITQSKEVFSFTQSQLLFTNAKNKIAIGSFRRSYCYNPDWTETLQKEW